MKRQNETTSRDSRKQSEASAFSKLKRGVHSQTLSVILATYNKKHDRKLRHLLSERSPDDSGSGLKDKGHEPSLKELSALQRGGFECRNSASRRCRGEHFSTQRR